MDIVVKVAAGMLIIQPIQKHLAGMGKGCMADIMTQRDSLYQVQVQIQSAADGTGNAADQLHMEASACNIIIFNQGKHLGLIGITVIVGAVHDPVDILGELGTPDRGRCVVTVPPDGFLIREGAVHKAVAGFLLLHLRRQSFR